MRITLLLILLFAGTYSYSQTLIWSDDFENTASQWTLNTQTGANGPESNIWEISDDEGGKNPGECGEANNGNKTLYVTCDGTACSLLGATGAAYYSGDGGVAGPQGDATTAVRATLNTGINTTGESNLELKFNWLGVGQANTDYAELEYSIDGGTSWNTIWTQTPGQVCQNGQGEWAEATVNLPSDAENVSDLRFALHWRNDNDTQGDDPSFAIDNMRLYADGDNGSNEDEATANFTTASFTVCVGDCIDFTDLSVGNNISSWNWSFQGAATASSNTQNPSNICYNTLGQFDVTLTIVDDNGPVSTTMKINVEDCSGIPPVALFTTDTLIVCAGDCINFIDLSLGNPSQWYWTFDGAATTSSTEQNPKKICYFVPGVYNVTLKVTNAMGSDEISGTISVGEAPLIIGYGDTLIDIGGSAILHAEPLDPGFVFWEPASSLDCETCTEVVATPVITTVYYPSLIGANGCIGRDTVLVVVDFQEIVEVPSAFTPYGGKNNKLHVLGVGLTAIDFKIYNRYGQLIFETDDLKEGWDGTFNGKELNQGVFVYTLRYNLIDGSSGEKSGNVTLIK